MNKKDILNMKSLAYYSGFNGLEIKKIERLADEYRENKRLIEELTAMNDGLKMEIIALMNNQETVSIGTNKISYTTVNSSRFDSNNFKKAYPALYENFITKTAYKRFTIV